MTDFIKMCATLGLLTMYVAGTGIFGGLTYRFLKHRQKESTEGAALRGLLVSYTLGLIVFMCVSTYFLICRG